MDDIFVGALVDRYGVRPFLLLILFGRLVTDIGILINFAFIEQLPLQFFYIETLPSFFGGHPMYYLGKLCNYRTLIQNREPFNYYVDQISPNFDPLFPLILQFLESQSPDRTL